MKHFLNYLILISLWLMLPQVLFAQQLSLDWASYYGGPNTRVTAAQYDPVNNTVYICGSTKDSLGISTPGSHKPSFGPFFPGATIYEKEDLFIARFDTAGNRLWATYYGGENRSFIPSLSIDPAGNVYITGLSYSLSGIASPNGFYNTGSQTNAPAGFLAKFNPQGQRIWSSYYSIPTIIPLELSAIMHWRIAFDATANVYITGTTAVVQGISTTGSHQLAKDTTRIPIPTIPYSNWPLNTDAFLVKFDSTGNRIWGTYYGGSNNDWAAAVYAEPSGNVFIAGFTYGSDTSDESAIFTSPGAFLDTLNGTSGGFLAKFDAAGNRLWGTFLGGNGNTYIQDVKGDTYGNIYVFGHTLSSIHIGTLGTHQATNQGIFDAFLMKFNGAGQRLWGTYFGGSGGEMIATSNQGGAYANPNTSLIVAPEHGGIYISGSTSSNNGIATACTYEATQGIGGYIAKFDTSGQLLMGSYYDAPISDISRDSKGNIYFSSWSNLDSLATPGSFLATKPQGQQAGIFGKFNEKYHCPLDTLNLVRVNNTLIAEAGYLSYKWFRDGILVATSTNPQFTITDSGSYYVKVEGNCNCFYNSDTVQTGGLSIKNAVNKMQLSISPNPAHNYISIHSKENMGVMNYQIIDILGKESQKGIFKAAFKSENINIETLSPGIYVLKINNNIGIANFKFIKE